MKSIPDFAHVVNSQFAFWEIFKLRYVMYGVLQRDGAQAGSGQNTLCVL